MPDFDQLEQITKTFTFGLPRLYIIFVMMPVLSKRMLGGAMVRNGVMISLALFIYPITASSLPGELSTIDYALIFVKELCLGLVIGLIATIPFWVAEGVGFFIDNQRGASMASTVNPILGEQTSPLGIFFTQLLSTVFVVSGSLLLLYKALAQSYIVWPVGVLFPSYFIDLDLYAYAQLDYLMRMIVVMAAPIILAMFLAEFALALISRFAPQLNVFFLAMPIKSGVAFAFLTFYVAILMTHLNELVVMVPDKILNWLTSGLPV